MGSGGAGEETEEGKMDTQREVEEGGSTALSTAGQSVEEEAAEGVGEGARVELGPSARLYIDSRSGEERHTALMQAVMHGHHEVRGLPSTREALGEVWP